LYQNALPGAGGSLLLKGGKRKLFQIQEDISGKQRLDEDSAVAINSRQRRIQTEF
jgi:hypothetical protein